MARAPRIEYADAFYHITARGNARHRIFADDFDREMLLDIVKAAHKRFGFIVHAFVLMDNHYHFLLQTPEPNLSASMRDINGIYTQSFNRRHKRVGHVFQGRFKPIVVDRDEYYLELIRYIHLNPWRAQAVKRLDQFRYSSHAALIDQDWARKWRPWYDRDIILREFGKREREALEAYLEFITEGKGKESPLKHVIGGYALGDRNFADRLWERFIEGRDEREITGSKRMRPQLGVLQVIRAVRRALDVSEAQVFESRRGRRGANLAKLMTLHILNRYSGHTQKEIGAACGGLNRMAVSSGVRRLELLIKDDAELKLLYSRALLALGIKMK